MRQQLERGQTATFEARPGRNHPSTLGSPNNLANAHRAAGQTKEAVDMLEQELLTREQELGHDHPSTLGSRNNLANAYQAAGRAAEAVALHEQVLAARRRVLGPDHPDTVQSQNNLARAIVMAGAPVKPGRHTHGRSGENDVPYGRSPTKSADARQRTPGSQALHE